MYRTTKRNRPKNLFEINSITAQKRKKNVSKKMEREKKNNIIDDIPILINTQPTQCDECEACYFFY